MFFACIKMLGWRWYGATLLYAVLWYSTQGGCLTCPGGGYTLPLECTVYPPCNDSIAQIFYACFTEIENLGGIHPQLSQNPTYFILCKRGGRFQYRMQFPMSICYCRVLRKQKLRPAIDCPDSCSQDNRPHPHCIICTMPVFDWWVTYWITGKFNIK